MQKGNKSTYYKLAIIWLAIILMGCFWFSVKSTDNPIVLTVMPQAPRDGEPVLATVQLNNPENIPVNSSYRFYANGVLIKEGQTILPPLSGETFQYSYQNTLPLGEQVSFMVSSHSATGDYEKMVSTPPYAPQIWTSFISFASFSTSVMSSMSSIAFYHSNFSDMGLNIGILTSVILIFLLIFLELSGNRINNGSLAIGRLRIRLMTLTWILLIIFVGMVYTRVAMILTT
jgi:hypothetical protein